MDQRQEIEIKAQAFKFHFLIIGTGILFFILLFRLVSLQIYHGEKLKKFSDSNRFKKQLLVAPRGLILDRQGQILAGSKKTTQLIVHLNSARSLDLSLQKISQIIQIPVKKLKTIIEKSKKRNGPFHPVILKEGLSLIEVHKLKQLYWDHAEIQVREIEKRIYPLKENGSQILGFIGFISKKDIQALKKQKRMFHLSDVIGKSGLEKAYDEELKGRNGFSMIEVDAQNRLSGQHSSHPFDFLKIDPLQGKDLALTIDKDLQKVALKAMKRQDSIGPRTGSVIVMKTNGEILVMLSEPGFDPNTLSFNMDKTLWEKWSAKGSKMFVNKGFHEHYSPGSVFKPFVALAALEEGIITKDSLIHSPGTFKVGQRVYRDHNPAGHGNINLVTAIEKSANTFFYQIADQLGIEKIYSYAQLFGFGRKTHIEIPGESPGLLPHPSWKEKISNQRWQRGDTINISIGQGELLTTLLQLTVAYNAIATQGLMVQPFLVRKKPNGEINKPVILDSLTDRIQRSHFITVREGLKKVVKGPQGTARWYQLPFVSFAGKTGTAQVISLVGHKLYKDCKQLPKKYKHHGWFVSLAPSDRPEIIVSVFTEHSCSGSSGSAPIARDIIRHYFKKRELEK